MYPPYTLVGRGETFLFQPPLAQCSALTPPGRARRVMSSLHHDGLGVGLRGRPPGAELMSIPDVGEGSSVCRSRGTTWGRDEGWGRRVVPEGMSGFDSKK